MARYGMPLGADSLRHGSCWCGHLGGVCQPDGGPDVFPGARVGGHHGVVDRVALSLRVDEWEAPDWPVVTILVDGRELTDVVGGRSFVGFDPDQILSDEEPLVPGVLPERIAVYRCHCGEPGCGCLAPLIIRRGSEILWRDARDYTGVFVKPSLDRPPTATGTRLRMPELRFDAAQYEAEVRRAAQDRSWETDRRATARLLRSMLGESESLLGAGYGLQWVVPERNAVPTFSVSLLDPSRVQVVVEVEAPAQDPDKWAAELAQTLLAKRPEEWRVAFRGNFEWPPVQ